MLQHDAILVDAKNALYRAIFAGHSDKKFKASGNDPSTIVVRFLRSYIQKFKPSSVHIFWDTPKSRIWRKSLLAEYKEGRHKDHGFDVEAAIKNCSKTCMRLFKMMGIYQYQRDSIEADDLIYAWCRVNRRMGKSVIVSNDSDFVQIPFLFDDVSLYDPLTKGGRIVDIPDIDAVDVKCFAGDKSDAIPGYYNIGPVRADKIVRDRSFRKSFFEEHGREIYDRNKKLIDLSLCPQLAENMAYVLEVLTEEVSFEEKEIKKFIFRVKGLTAEYSNAILPFKFIKNT